MMKQDPLVGGFARATLDERRRSNRMDHNTTGTLLPDVEDGYSGALPVHVKDVSRHGVGFTAPAPLPVGGRYRIRIGAGPLHLESRLRVVACRRRADGAFGIGAEFA